MKSIKKIIAVLGMVFALSSVYAEEKAKSKMPMYIKTEIGFKGGNIFNKSVSSTYATFGNIKPVFGFAPIPNLPNLSFEGYLEMSFVTAKIGFIKVDVFNFIPGAAAIWTFTPDKSWSMFAGGGFEIPIENVNCVGVKETTTGFDLTGLVGIKTKISGNNEVMADFDVSFISYNTWGFNAGFAHYF